MITTTIYSNVTALKAAVSKARQESRDETRRDIGRGGLLLSRGAFIRVVGVNGNIIKGECDAWPFSGTAAEFKELADLLRYDSAVREINIQGGWDWAVNTRAYNDCDYDPLVGDWEVVFGTKEEEPEDTARAQALAAEEAKVGDTIHVHYEHLSGPGDYVEGIVRAVRPTHYEYELTSAMIGGKRIGQAGSGIAPKGITTVKAPPAAIKQGTQVRYISDRIPQYTGRTGYVGMHYSNGRDCDFEYAPGCTSVDPKAFRFIVGFDELEAV